MKEQTSFTENAGIENSRGYVQPFIDFRHGDGVAGMASIKTGTVKCVLIDPPYLYLKGQKLEREFDEFLYFSKVKRVLRDDGFIVMFGRGASFYRWNNYLETLGFRFKEEIVWDKSQSSSPLHSISRVHEAISIWTKKNGIILKSKVPYLDMKGHDVQSIIGDIKRLMPALNNPTSLSAIAAYLENGKRFDYEPPSQERKSKIVRVDAATGDRACNVIQSMTEGLKEKSIITIKKHKHSTSVQPSELCNEDRSLAVLKAMDNGLNEKSIIKEVRDHYTSFHPTQKPVPLLKRLLNLTTEKGDLVVDNFAGSASSGQACAELERNWIGWEIDKEYYDLAINKRLSKLSVQVSLF